MLRLSQSIAQPFPGTNANNMPPRLEDIGMKKIAAVLFSTFGITLSYKTQFVVVFAK
jgi:hypothetical protein